MKKSWFIYEPGYVVSEDRLRVHPMPAAETPGEILIAKRSPWYKRLWVRIYLSTLLIFTVLFANWYIPRRGVVSLFWVNGMVYPHHSINERNSFASTGTRDWDKFLRFYNDLNSCFPLDCNVRKVDISHANVDHEWIKNLNNCFTVTDLQLRDRQLGPGLEHLPAKSQIKCVSVGSASGRHLSELERFTQMSELELCAPQVEDIELDSLRRLASLTYLKIDNCEETNELLSKLPTLPSLKVLSFYNCNNFSGDDLVLLQKMPNLTHLMFKESVPIDNAGWQNLSELSELQMLLVMTIAEPVSESALNSLGKLTNLKSLVIYNSGISEEVEQKLKQMLPNTEFFLH